MSENVNSEQKPSVRIKMKVGSLEFEIECAEDQVKEMVEKVLSSVTDYANKPLPQPVPITQMSSLRAETCRGVIERLWKDGWFSEPRILNDVDKEMIRVGYHYDRTAIAHVLLDLVRDGILTREGRAKRYMYTQKRPPTPQTN